MKTTGFALVAALSGAVFTPTSIPAGPPSMSATRAFTLRMEGKSDEARTLLERSLAETPDDDSAWFELARTEFYHFRFDAAEVDITRAVELAPENARYHYFAGITATYDAVSKAHSAETMQQVDAEMGKALAAFERAVQIDPEFHEARLQLINMLMKVPSKQGGSRAKAREHVERLESRDAVYGVAGSCMLVADDKPGKAVALWQQAVAAHATRADAHAGLAKACLGTGDIDRAVSHIDEAIRLDPSQRGLLLALCRQYVSEGENARAQNAVERYVRVAPAPPAPLRSYATFCLAQLQRMQGNEEQAETRLVEAKQLDPHGWMTYMEPPEALFEAP